MQQEETDDLSMDRSVLKLLAANIETLRHQPNGKYLTQGEVAKRAGFDQTTLGRMLSFSHSPSLEKIALLAQAFGKQPWQLIAPDMGVKIRADGDMLSPSAMQIARRFDEIKDEAERAKAFAFISHTLLYSNFSAYPTPQATPPAAKPKRTRARRKPLAQDPSTQSEAPGAAPSPEDEA
jgi:transcriptional regulator with XRE-family HTH domain